MLLCPKRTADREALFRWVGPVNSSNFGVYVNAQAPLHFDRLEDLYPNLPIVVPRSAYFLPILKSHNLRNIEEVNTTEDAIRMLIQGRVKIAVLESEIMKSVMKSNDLDGSKIKLAHPIYESLDYFAFSIDAPNSMIEKWQNALDDMTRSGDSQRIRDRFAK